ncbi:MAG: acetate/propionate family kinase [Bacteroidales bacterium]|nr:acetate/propionate family kinase [Bacteroidales bacterium]
MQINGPSILIINGGSSTIRFALYAADATITPLFHGKIDRIGLPDSTLTYRVEGESQKKPLSIDVSDNKSSSIFLIKWLEKRVEFASVKAVGHRIVHGMNHTEPAKITPALLDELRLIIPYDPDHLPNEIIFIETLLRRYPALMQVACFDTAFHTTMPRVAKLLPIPRRFDAKGIQRYGFHGISYSYLMEELTRMEGLKAVHGRVILAHLGNGASMVAVNDGKSIDTSMGFTPAGGLVMSSRSGDLDPGVAWYMIQSENLTPKQFNHLINHESGLLGISQISSDMHDLLAQEATDFRAAEAVDLFCYQAKKWIGSFVAALGGLDMLVFSGGIGENSSQIRSRICMGLQCLGIELDEKQNSAHAPIISTENTLVKVRVINTNEEWMMAKIVRGMF